MKNNENDSWKVTIYIRTIIYILRDISYDNLKFGASSNHNMFILVLVMFSFTCHETQKSGLV